MAGAGAWLAQRLEALVDVFRNRELRRVELAWGGFHVGEWAHVVALAVFAYEAGGAAAVGLVGLVRMLPAAAAVPFAAVLVDRYPRERVLLAVHLVRAAAIAGGAAALFGDAHAAVVYALATVAAVASAAFRPCHLALLPLLSTTPRELVAANVSSATLEGLATLGGPALAGVLLAVFEPAVAFSASAAIFLGSALAVGGVSCPRVGQLAARARAGVTAELLAGVRTLAVERDVVLLIGLIGAQTLVRGFLNVLVVVASIELLGLGESGVGWLNSAFGAGGIAGALASVALVGRPRLARFFQLGLVLWGLPIALVGGVPEAALALFCLALVGLGNAVLDVAGFTLIQRSVDDSVLGRVFGMMEMVAITCVGVGSILAPPLVDGAGIRWALVAVGGLLPALAVLCERRLRRVDAAAVAHVREVELLRALPIFAPLPLVTLEQLAGRLGEVRAPAGTVVIRQGDPGDLFYVIEEGRARVRVDGEPVGELGPGDSFGEIALLRDVPRTATVEAATDLVLRTLGRDVFVKAVGGHEASAVSAEEVVASRLLATRVPTAPL